MDTPAHSHPAALDDPRTYDDVLFGRTLASVFDVTIIGFLTLLIYFVMFVFAVVTLGLGALLFFLPILPVLAIAYFAYTVGSPAQASYGMRIMGVRLERLDGQPVGPALAAIHSILFWVSVSLLKPAVLLIGFFTERRQLGHDLLLGTVVVPTARVG